MVLIPEGLGPLVSPYTLTIIVRLVGPSFVVSLAVELMSLEDSYTLVVCNVVLGQSESADHASESNIFFTCGTIAVSDFLESTGLEYQRRQL